MGVRGLMVLLVWQVAVCAGAAEPAPKVDYDREIRPILSDRCYRCHGPDSAARQADMRLDRRDGIPEEVIVAGKPDESELVRRIMSVDEDERMPPPASHLALSVEEKTLLARWIQEGAKFTEHWSFRPLPARIDIPPVRDVSWPRNAIDRFVLARLESERLKPSTRAEPQRLLRRVTLDLTGLPPTPQEIRSFERAADGDFDAAYTDAVDRLLASPAYGEQMAVAWLDASRYADSYGYQSDQLNTEWPYRDWVIRALNSNLPYNQFVTWQLAGDLLANPTPDQILATAFNRLHRITREGGSIGEECMVLGVADRVQTFGMAMLGLTLECARCHDHKFDPITSRDYYSLSAFFNSIDENGMYDHSSKVPPPSLMLPTDEQQLHLAAARGEIAHLEAALAETCRLGETRFETWLAAAPSLTEPPDMSGYFSFDGDLATLANQVPGKVVKTKTHDLPVGSGIRGKAVEFDGDRGVEFCDFMEVDRWDSFSFDLWLRDTVRNSQPVVILHRTFGTDTGHNGFDVMLADGHLQFRIYRVWPGNGIGVRALEPIARDRWQHVAATYDGSSRAKGLRLFLDGTELPTEVLRDRIYKSAELREPGGDGYLTLGERMRDRGFQGGAIDEFRCFERALTPLEIQNLHDGEAFAAARADVSTQRDALREVYFSAVDPAARELHTQLRDARRKLVEQEESVQEVPVMEELAEARPAYILPRGAFDAPKSSANRVERDTFKDVLPPFPADAPRNRLGLAEWLTEPNHPLTSRVFVNRLWSNFFGRSLVATPENFGRQGAAPSHPELLDWLARDFVDHGWDIKRLCREIVLSATYRQDSRLRPELRERDPENQLLARGPSRRMTAEQIRDVALAASGLLDPRRGGPPVSPYQPGEDLWREANAMSPKYQMSVGTDLYRRSIYSVWKRTAPLPNMTAFDATSREVCVVSRGRTSTPLQALVLLNDVQFVEAARALAGRVAHDHGSVGEQIGEAFVRLTGRTPDAMESEILRQVYDEQRTLFSDGDEQDARKFIQHGESKPDSKLAAVELAALTATCQVILNLDATIYER